MAKGSVYPSEVSTYQDPKTGVAVQRLTNHLCHSNHFYFTHNFFYDGCRRMLFHSDRRNTPGLYSLNRQSGEITQLTDDGTGGAIPLGACLNPERNEVYYRRADRTVYSLDLGNLSERLVWELPERDLCGPPSCSADGRFLYMALGEDMSDRVPFDMLRSAPGFREYWEARPRCRVVRVPVCGGEAETVWEEDNWVGHVNTSPRIPNILTFCHEGPWTRVSQRIWGLDGDTGRAWRIRPQDDGAIVGHEYWFADGSAVAYQGRTSRAGDAGRFWGRADFRTGGHADFEIPRRATHFHSLSAEMLVSDGHTEDPYLALWRWNGTGYDGRLLCQHRCSMHVQRLHVHPTVTPDGKGIIYTSDINGYGDVYCVEFPEFDSLPPA